MVAKRDATAATVCRVSIKDYSSTRSDTLTLTWLSRAHGHGVQFGEPARKDSSLSTPAAPVPVTERSLAVYMRNHALALRGRQVLGQQSGVHLRIHPGYLQCRSLSSLAVVAAVGVAEGSLDQDWDEALAVPLLAAVAVPVTTAATCKGIAKHSLHQDLLGSVFFLLLIAVAVAAAGCRAVNRLAAATAVVGVGVGRDEDRFAANAKKVEQQGGWKGALLM